MVPGERIAFSSAEAIDQLLAILFILIEKGYVTLTYGIDE